MSEVMNFAPGFGDHTVQKQFGRHNINGWGSDVPRVVGEVTACSDTNTVRIFLLRSDIGKKLGSGCLASFRQGGRMDEVDGIVSSDANIIAALGDLSELACIGCISGGAGGSTEELVGLLFDDCGGAEDIVGFWEEFDWVRRLSVVEVGDGHAACE